MKNTLLMLIVFIFILSSCKTKREAGNTNGKNGDEPVTSFVIDLAQQASTGTYQVSNDQKFTITFVDASYRVPYTVDGVANDNPLPPLTPPNAANPQNLTGAIDRIGGEDVAQPDPCGDLKKLMDTTIYESVVNKFFARAVGITGCDFETVNRGRTSLKYNSGTPTSLHNGSLEITITNPYTHKSWKFTFTAKGEGKFLTTYGFTFIPLIFGKPHTYYAQQQPIPTVAAGQPAPTPTYIITENSTEDHINYAPTVMFHWLQFKKDKYSVSWTAGLGLNLASSNNNTISPLAFMGGSVLFHQNIGLSIGLAGHTVSQLQGNYNTNIPITTNLSATDLNRQTIVANPFVSITFRFSSNPNTTNATKGLSTGQ